MERNQGRRRRSKSFTWASSARVMSVGLSKSRNDYNPRLPSGMYSIFKLLWPLETAADLRNTDENAFATSKIARRVNAGRHSLSIFGDSASA